MNKINRFSEELNYSPEQEKEIKYFVDTHCSLNNKNGTRKYEDILNDFKKNRKLKYIQEQDYLAINYIDYYFNKYYLDRKQYGIVVGRFMPFTNGHNTLVQDIIRDGRTPIMFLGGVGKKDDRHPLSFEERVKIIKKIYPFGVIFIGIEDKDNWTEWFSSIEDKIREREIKKENILLYSHNKEIDRVDFEYKGKHYKSEFYTKIFEENGIKIKKMDEVVCNLGKVIHASDVRRSEEIAKRNLDARIYRELKDKYGWWKYKII